VTHGTPAGYDAGCRGIECLNLHTDLMTCKEAHTRFQGDYTYRLAVKAGTATAEKETFKTKVADKAKAPAPVRARRATGSAPVVRAPRETRPIVHGTFGGYDRGCRDRALCPAPNGINCPDARNLHQRKFDRRRGMKERVPAAHGTISGYSGYKCYTPAECPSAQGGGISCSEARKTYRAQLTKRS